MWDTLARGDAWTGHLINRRKNGARYEEEATISPIRDESGKIVNYVAVKRDVTQEVALEGQLRQAQKMEAIGQLSGGVAHDFNNILTVIHGSASLLLAGILKPEEQRDYIDSILQASGRAATLTRQLLLFSRKEVMQPAILDLNDVVVQISKMLQRTLGEDISLVVHCDPGLPALRADRGMIEQVLLNLAVNARDAMPKGGRLVVSTGTEWARSKAEEQDPDQPSKVHVWLEVTDDGCGIPAENLPHIFEPFFTTKPVGKGTGLGLATVYGIVEQHGGRIGVSSELGKGTRFHVSLPASPESSVELNPLAAPTGMPTGNETLLVVEDDLSVRQMVSQNLERCGYTVLRAETGPAAMEVWAAHRDQIDLLLTDLIMPGGMNGVELARMLQAQKPQLKVLLTSGYPAKAGEGTTLIEGVTFLPKPYPFDKLAQTVRCFLDRQTVTLI
jgi:signal transduction histidine kinase/ActR/RegA family two-component response regulator